MEDGSSLQRVQVVVKVFGTEKAASTVYQATSTQHGIGVHHGVNLF